jgi:hypothetical protein
MKAMSLGSSEGEESLGAKVLNQLSSLKEDVYNLTTKVIIMK